MHPAIANYSIETVNMLHEIFGYDIEINGDSMTADVYLIGVYLYTVAIA